MAQAAEQGARTVKWLPAAQGMDPPSPRCDAFYQALSRDGSALLAHAGAVLSDTRRHNPLLFDLVLKRSLRVNGAGCAPRVFESRRVFQPAAGSDAGPVWAPYWSRKRSS